MKLVILSGRSGSGKTTALRVLEDIGFYCIDNLPAALLPALIQQYQEEPEKRLAACIDARNQVQDIACIQNTLSSLPDSLNTEIIYLDATSSILIKRFSETRRRHPLTDKDTPLKLALEKEKHMLEPLALMADLQINTNQMNVHDLRSLIKKRLEPNAESHGMSLLFTSFGFKHGIPVDADMVFDVRCLPNPHWEPDLREHTGLEAPIQAYLSDKDEVSSMREDIIAYLNKWLPSFEDNNRSYMTIAIGCTGGKHRSVFMSEQLLSAFSEQYPSCQVFHRELHKQST